MELVEEEWDISLLGQESSTCHLPLFFDGFFLLCRHWKKSWIPWKRKSNRAHGDCRRRDKKAKQKPASTTSWNSSRYDKQNQMIPPYSCSCFCDSTCCRIGRIMISNQTTCVFWNTSVNENCVDWSQSTTNWRRSCCLCWRERPSWSAFWYIWWNWSPSRESTTTRVLILCRNSKHEWTHCSISEKWYVILLRSAVVLCDIDYLRFRFCLYSS